VADIYGAAPVFSAGQVLSASAHLNALQSYVQAVRDDFVGVAMPFSAATGRFEAHTDPGYASSITSYHFGLRHKFNYLSYSYTVTSGYGEHRIRIKDGVVDVLVPGSAHSGLGTFTGTDVDISSLGLTPNAFYDISVEQDYETWVAGALYVTLLCETQGATGVPPFTALPTFSDLMVPTAGQALSTRATGLGAQTCAPQPTGQCTWDSDGQARLGPHRKVRGTFNHRARYLAYFFTAMRSDNRDGPLPSGLHWTDGILKINGVSVLRRRVGGANAPGTAAVGEDYLFVDARDQQFSGVLDLNIYPGNLVLGTDYTWEFTYDARGGGYRNPGDLAEGGSNATLGLHYLFEYTDSSDALAGWTAFVAWAHGLNVLGNSGSPQVQTLVANLNLLNTVTNYHNYASVMDRGVGPGNGLYGIRRWRYLHYRTDPQAGKSHATDDEPYDPLPPVGTRTIASEPVLIYTYKTKEKRVTLTDAYYKWYALDLESVEGLLPGVPYKLENVKYAIEDVVG
jgi:hypothetical protein